jgi:hypothetical protein
MAYSIACSIPTAPARPELVLAASCQYICEPTTMDLDCLLDLKLIHENRMLNCYHKISYVNNARECFG